MSNKKKIYVIIFSLVFLTCLFGFIWSFTVTKDIRKNANEGAKNQVVTVKNLVLTETKESNIYWELYAAKGSYDSTSGDVVLSDPIGNFYNTEGEVVLSFESDLGIYDEKNKEITLKGDTLVVAQGGYSIKADKIIWHGADEDITAAGNVVINKDKDLVAYASNAKFNSELTSFEISGKSVTNVYSKDGAVKTQELLSN